MGSRVYVITRDRGIHSDGFYYEKATSIIGIFEKEKEACEMLVKISDAIYPNTKPIRGAYNETGETERIYHICDDLVDEFRIEEIVIGIISPEIHEMIRKKNSLLND